MAKTTNESATGSTNPPETTPGDEYTWRKKWIPTPKWTIALVVGLGGVATAMIESDDEWSSSIQIMVVTLVVERLSAYIAPNKGATSS